MIPDNNYRIINWTEKEFLKYLYILVKIGTIQNYTHKIELNTGVNVYLVSGKLFDEIEQNGVCRSCHQKL